MKKGLALLLALVLVLSLFAACSNTEPEQTDAPDTSAPTESVTDAAPDTESIYGGHLDVRIASKPSGLDPLKFTGIWRYVYTTCVFENALTRDADDNIAPGVCDYELSDDYLTLKLWVRDGMAFHNGDPVDIYDVKASIERAMTLYKSFVTYVTPYVESITVDDAAKTMTIQFTEYRERIWYYLAAYQTWCAIMPKEICEKYADDYIIDQVEDAIGTGPYKISELKLDEYITLSKWEDYVVQESDRSGFAGPKYGYLDTMTFWFNGDDASAALATLAGDYDIVEAMPTDYMDMLESSGLTVYHAPSNTGTVMYFNCKGEANVCAKYPSLRRAIMAAVDYEEFLTVVTDNQQVMGGCIALSSRFDTDVFETADYYGKTDLAVVEKYLQAAKDEGWDGVEPVALVLSSDRNDIPTMLSSYLENAGIPFTLETMEGSAYSEFTGSPDNLWDFYFTWTNYATTPTLVNIGFIENNYKSINGRKDTLLDQMYNLNPQSEEYLALWQELADEIVTDCCSAYMSMIDWYWFHAKDLVINDEGLVRYFFNTYWSNPEAHRE